MNPALRGHLSSENTLSRSAGGVRASRSLPADPARATHTTGFRIALDIDEEVP